MLKVENSKEKEERILNEIAGISSWWHKWEENRDGQRVVCIEYSRLLDVERDGISADGEVT